MSMESIGAVCHFKPLTSEVSSGFGSRRRLLAAKPPTYDLSRNQGLSLMKLFLTASTQLLATEFCFTRSPAGTIYCLCSFYLFLISACVQSGTFLLTLKNIFKMQFGRNGVRFSVSSLCAKILYQFSFESRFFPQNIKSKYCGIVINVNIYQNVMHV